MTAMYIIAGWVAIQVMSEALPALGLEDSAIRYVWIAVLAGFPLALLFSWKYDITVEGIRRTAAGAEATAEELRLGRTDYVLLSFLLLLAIAGAANLIQIAMREQAAVDVAPETREIYAGSIAVLPLENLSPDSGQEYFASGMYDTLINSLCKVSALRVTSRTSASRVDTGLSVPMIGRTLGVANLIEGSIYREGNRVRVVIQLIDTASDQHLWAETYERDFTDVMGLQADVARAVARAVQVRLTAQDESQLARSLDIRPDTFESYLRAMFQFRKETRRAYRKGIEILEEALENDPTSALAYAGLAQGYSELGHSPFPVRGAYPRARAAADKAIELDDTLAEAHLAVAMYRLYYEYDWDGAEQAFDRALELNPSLSDAWYHWAWQLELFGKDEEAIAAGEKTVELSPLSPFYISWLAEQYRDAGYFEKAIDMAESVLRLYPEYPVAWLVLGNAYGELAEFEEAIEAHAHLGDSAFWSWARGYTYAQAGQEDRAREIIAGIEHEPDNGLPLTLLYASVGDAEQAMHWLGQVAEIRMPWYPWLVGWFPQFRGLHDDPSVVAKAKELGVPLQQGPS
jgi:TolB-like protein/Tfp pilus assembly protein PilF